MRCNQPFTLDVNGQTHTVDADPDMPLLYALRNELGLNNPHFGCGLAQCGACTVHVDGEPTRSCVTPVSAVGQAQGHDPRRARHAGEAAPAADRFHRRAGAAMRLLPQRLDHDRGRAAARQEPHPTERRSATRSPASNAAAARISHPARRPARGQEWLGEERHDQISNMTSPSPAALFTAPARSSSRSPLPGTLAVPTIGRPMRRRQAAAGARPARQLTRGQCRRQCRRLFRQDRYGPGPGCRDRPDRRRGARRAVRAGQVVMGDTA